MSDLFLDIETTFQTNEKGKKDPSPYIANNYLVSYGLAESNDDVIYKCVRHNDKNTDKDHHRLLQDKLDNTTLLIAHNIKFELAWLRACGFRYNGSVACTQIREYVLARGQKLPVNLEDSCERNNVSRKKSGLVQSYLDAGAGFEAIHWDTVEEYGIADVEACRALYLNQLKRLEAAPHLWPTVHLMEEFCQVLVDMEEDGIKIDIEELDRLEKDYKHQLQSLKNDLNKIVEDIMGATPINLDSPEQLSQIVYSRRVTNKHKWKELFNLGTEYRGAVLKPKRKPYYTERQFVDIIKQYTEPVYKTVAEHCEICNGVGKIRKTKKDGSLWAKESICRNCIGRGYTLTSTGKIAGLRCLPISASDTAAGGFSTDKEIFQSLAERSDGVARDFILKSIECNKIETYLSTFIGGIRRGIRDGSILHTSFMQCITATGRLSSQNPNLQNQPRGGTFPVRAVFISRFEDGLVTEADAKQLEFRTFGELTDNKQVYEDVIANIDVHAVTASVLESSRQDAKPDTFAPLYGAMPEGKSEKRAAYYRHFIDKYSLNIIHEEWFREVIETGGYKLPSGRELWFSNTKRLNNGSVTNATTIKNYRVQSFATADIIPLYCIEVQKLIKKYQLKSKLILTVHDSVVIDTHPTEKDIAVNILKEAWHNTIRVEPLKRWNYVFKFPLEIEIKQGVNLLKMKEVI